jgi:hypothetical protein
MLSFEAYKQGTQEIENQKKYYSLKVDWINHLWSLKGNNQIHW